MEKSVVNCWSLKLLCNYPVCTRVLLCPHFLKNPVNQYQELPNILVLTCRENATVVYTRLLNQRSFHAFGETCEQDRKGSWLLSSLSPSFHAHFHCPGMCWQFALGLSGPGLFLLLMNWTNNSFSSLYLQKRRGREESCPVSRTFKCKVFNLIKDISGHASHQGPVWRPGTPYENRNPSVSYPAEAPHHLLQQRS